MTELPVSNCIVSGLHHVGMSVADLDVALGFWRRFLGVFPRWRTTLDSPYLGSHVGYAGIAIEVAFLDLPGGLVLELLDYNNLDSLKANPEATANPGNTHLCLAVRDASDAWRRAVRAGARPVVPAGPVRVDAGPNEGAQVAYLRIHDSITLELYQLPSRPQS